MPHTQAFSGGYDYIAMTREDLTQHTPCLVQLEMAGLAYGGNLMRSRQTHATALIPAHFKKQVANSSRFGGQTVTRCRPALSVLGLMGFLLAGCMQATLVPSSTANLTSRDRQL